MSLLSSLKNTARPVKKVQRVGRGDGSGRGKTCCRGNKGDKSRSGYKRRYGQEGGQLPLYRKLPIRGFSRGAFIKESFSINFSLINTLFNEGEVVNAKTLCEKGLAPRKVPGGVKILSTGTPKKGVRIEANAFSKAALKKLDEHGVQYQIVSIADVSKKG